jgi:hypothetical protein
MFANFDENAWLYHRGEWSRIKNPLYDARWPGASAPPRRPTWRQILRDYRRKWGDLGPTSALPNYYGILVSVYSYTGDGKAPEYLIRIIAVSADEVIYSQDLPDLLEVLTLLAPLASNGIFTDAYMRGQSNR